MYVSTYPCIHSNLKTAIPDEEMPGGSTHFGGEMSLLAPESKRANPWNLPLSLTEKISNTFLQSEKALSSFFSFKGGVDHKHYK